MTTSARVAVAFVAAAVITVIPWILGAHDTRAAVAAGPGAPDASRLVMARIYQGGKWVLPAETPQSAGAALAQADPTYVSSLIRFQAGEDVTNKEVAAWNTVKAAVLAANPDAKFSIELNGLEYHSVKRMNAMMAKVRARFDNDGWLFDFYTPAAKKYPKVMAAAVANAHANNEFLGGNAFGITKHPKIPKGTDYIAVQDTNFRIDLKAVRELAKRSTVFFHLGNSPGFANSDGCVFIEKYSTAKRAAYVTRRAGQQDKYNFRFAYPIFFPECARKRDTPQVEIFAFNATRDGAFFETVGNLLERFDGVQ